jgi:hypothetical protein
MTDFLGTWQGVATALLVCVTVIAVIMILFKNLEGIKGLRLSKDGIRFDTVDLGAAIPRIDAQTKVKLQCVVKDIVERARAAINIDDYMCICPDDKDKLCKNTKTRMKIMKMLLVQTMMTPLYDSISRNHLVKSLSGENVTVWLKSIIAEIHGAALVIEDYCGVDLPDEALKNSLEHILKEYYVPQARCILLASVYDKRDVYAKLPESDKRRERFLEKCDRYIAGLN